MAKIVRAPTKATGGVTHEELEKMRAHTDMWIKRAFRTDPIEPEKIIPAIEGLYAAAGLKKPRVVIVPSPLVMAFAYGASAAIWYNRGRYSATRNATDSATDNATDSATDSATRNATDSATDSATYNATRNATDNATRNATDNATRNATDSATHSATDSAKKGAAQACFELAGEFGLACAARWGNVYQGGNMWAAYDSYLTAMRDIIGLQLPQHANYASWEKAAIEGGFRVMHPEFCIVSDFPEFIKIDDQSRPHCEDGPSHRWRDGWSLYHWHGVRIPGEWIEQKDKLTAKEALSQENLELRRVAIEIVGWNRILRELDAKVLDEHPDPECGTLVEVQLPDLDRRSRFIRARCGTAREFAVGVPPEIDSVIAGQAWLTGLPVSEFQFPSIRT